MIVLNSEDFAAADKYAKEEATDGTGEFHKGLFIGFRSAFIAGLNYATLKIERASKVKRNTK